MSSSKFERIQTSKKITTTENGESCYEYQYDIMKDGVKVNTKKVIVKPVKKANNKYNETDHKNLVITSLEKYFKDHDIKVPTLYKRMNLDKIIKDLIQHINSDIQVKCSQAQIRTIIKRDFLKLE